MSPAGDNTPLAACIVALTATSVTMMTTPSTTPVRRRSSTSATTMGSSTVSETQNNRTGVGKPW